MGVPKFYRWLSERFPLINQAISDATLLPEVDNLYLDLNGTIHNATHGDGASRKLEMKDVMMSIMTSIDHSVKLVKPRQLLYMAIDGVAPRAKMNQQRSRRFRAARDLEESRAAAVAAGEDLPKEDVFDSNCITPGTVFMAQVSAHLKAMVRARIKEDAAWRNLRVIFSGHEVPGEGEHKIVAYIRGAKLLPGYNPDTRHCMAGLDADLVMLALATHEPHFTLLREQVDFTAFRANKFGTKTATRTTAGKGYQLLHIGLLREYLEIDMRPPGWAIEAAARERAEGGAAAASALHAGASAGGGKSSSSSSHLSPASPLAGLPFAYDGDRVADDFILLVCLCGNDFLPHLPSLDIGEGAVDTLLRVYREQLPRWGGYLTDGGLIHWPRLQALLALLGGMEGEVFRARAAEAARFAAKQRRATRRVGDSVLGMAAGEEEGEGGEGKGERGGEDEDAPAPELPLLEPWLAEAAEHEITPAARAEAEARLLSAAAARLAAETGQGRGGVDENVVLDGTGKELRRPPSPYVIAAAAALQAEAAATGIAGEAAGTAAAAAAGVRSPITLSFKHRYYLDKFGVSPSVGVTGTPDSPAHGASGGPAAGVVALAGESSEGDGVATTDATLLRRLVRAYAEALQWVLLYYHRGVPSWGWFYPFHYAPMTSDLVGLSSLRVAFKLGQPFRPFQQLLGCLPAASAGFLPACYAELMTSSASPLADFYPDVAAIRIDMNGKRNPWEAVALIPFIQEGRMLAAIAERCGEGRLSEDEAKRNSFGVDYIISYDPAATETLPSTLPGALPDIPACSTRMEPFHLPQPAVLTIATAAGAAAGSSDASPLPLPILGVEASAAAAVASSQTAISVDAAGMAGAAHLYRSRPDPACVVPAPGYPTLHTLLFSPLLQAVKVNVFGMASRKDTLLLAVGEGGRRPVAEVEEEEDEGFLAGAASFHDAASPAGDASLRSPALDTLAHPHTAPLALDLDGAGGGSGGGKPGLLPPHLPLFATTYAPGTTVAAVRAHLRVIGGEGDAAAATTAGGSKPRALLARTLSAEEAGLQLADAAAFVARRLAAATSGGSGRQQAGSSAAAAPAASPALQELLQSAVSSSASASASRSKHAPLTARGVAACLLGRVVYGEWPHLREAVVVGVSDMTEAIAWHGAPDDSLLLAGAGVASGAGAVAAAAGGDGSSSDADASSLSHLPHMAYPVGHGEVEVTAHGIEEAVKWTRDAAALHMELQSGRRALGICGINTGKPSVLVTLRKLTGMVRDPDSGALHRVWGPLGSSAALTSVPELLLLRNPAPDARLQPHGPLALPQRFPVGSSVVVLRGPARGCTGVVTGYAAAEEGATGDAAAGAPQQLQLSLPDPPEPEPPFGHSIAATIRDRYFTSSKAAEALGISPSVLGKIVGSVIINPGRFDIGLNLRVSRHLFLPG